ncbi:MAG: carbohydrate ABC transporter permease [Paracoccaceae bacterium]
MKRKTFFIFVGPSVCMMLVFIALPLLSVLWQSFHVTQPIYEQVEVETCTAGLLGSTCVTEMKTRPILDEDGKILTKTTFVGLQSYRNVIEPQKFNAALANGSWTDLMNIRFWAALRFTLFFTLLTLPLVLGTGLMIALAVNNTLQRIKGPVIFISLLPFIVTPVIGALSIRWLFIGDGILTAGLEWWLDRDIAMFAQAWTIELMMYMYRVWHVAPFAFVVFYAGLQTVSQDAVEAAIIDGASRWQRLRYIVIPHLMPLVIFLTLIHLMDAYRAFEEIVGFSASAHVISLQWLTYEFLLQDGTGARAISRASASAILTMIGIAILLGFPLRRVWRDQRGS